MECAKAALAVCKDSKPILDGATPANWEAMNEVAKENGVVLGVWAESISDLYDTVKKLEAAGNKNLVLDVTGSPCTSLAKYRAKLSVTDWMAPSSPYCLRAYPAVL